MTRKIGFIDYELLKKILIDGYREGIREVGFYATGEPLLYKELDKVVLLAKSIGFEYIYITTNGMYATLERIKKLLYNGLNSIKFSINALDANTYKYIHGKDNFERVINNLHELYEYRHNNNMKFKIFVSYTMTRYSKKNMHVIKDFFKDYCDDCIVMRVINQSGLLPEIDDLLSVKENYSESELNNSMKLPCYMPFNSITVSYEGYMTACCADFQNFLAYADLNKVSLLEGWHNSNIVELRKKHIDKNVKGTLCENCVHNVKNMPVPLSRELATDFDSEKMFEFKSTQERISLFSRYH